MPVRHRQYHAFFRAPLWVLFFLLAGNGAMGQHQLLIQFADKDNSFNPQPLQLQTSFSDITSCSGYIFKLPSLLSAKGYPTASVDTILEEKGRTTIRLFLGKQYRWVKLQPGNIDKKALDESGFSARQFNGKLLDMQQLQSLEERIVRHYENNGYPFAAVMLDSILLDDDRMNARLQVKKGPFYHLDSLIVLGRAHISKRFLEHYLGLPRGSVYSRIRLEQVSKKILQLPYLQEIQAPDIILLGTGSLLKLYLAPKRSSQFNFLLGVLPASEQGGKLRLTADVNLDLKNMLGHGENFILKWQQLQTKSPRLNLGYQQPYIFNSNFGVDFLFDLFKKDSSFLQVNALLGLQYLLSNIQSGKVFFQWQNNFLLGGAVDTNLVIATKKLPVNIDVSTISAGLDYELNNTDYKLNPRRGNECRLTVSAGIKNIKKNSDITGIKDPSFNYASLYDSVKARSYQFRIKLSAAHYFPVGKQGAVKTSLSGGFYNSPDIFRNELFQIGGYKLLRGFDEESIYATQYAVLSAEYRYRLQLNSFLFVFADGGWVKDKYQSVNLNNTFISGGLGLAFETKFGLLNISYAAGKRDDVKFSLREGSKIHFGYVNYF